MTNEGGSAMHRGNVSSSLLDIQYASFFDARDMVKLAGSKA
jgi:hypothetical protein